MNAPVAGMEGKEKKELRVVIHKRKSMKFTHILYRILLLIHWHLLNTIFVAWLNIITIITNKTSTPILLFVNKYSILRLASNCVAEFAGAPRWNLAICKYAHLLYS